MILNKTRFKKKKKIVFFYNWTFLNLWKIKKKKIIKKRMVVKIWAWKTVECLIFLFFFLFCNKKSFWIVPNYFEYVLFESLGFSHFFCLNLMLVCYWFNFFFNYSFRIISDKYRSLFWSSSLYDSHRKVFNMNIIKQTYWKIVVNFSLSIWKLYNFINTIKKFYRSNNIIQ